MRSFIFIIYFIFSLPDFAQQVQWASKLIDYSSEWIIGVPENSSNFKARQVLGYPNTLVYGTSPLAWAPQAVQSGKEYLTVEFDQPQQVQQIIIGETYNAGAVYQIILYDNKGKGYVVYENKTPAFKDNTGQVLIPYKITPTPYQTKKLKLILNTNKVGGMQQIDCIGISSSTAPIKLKINEVSYNEQVGAPENLGANVNSEFYDHLPVLSPDEQILYFARKWADGNTGKEQKDDIYFSYQLANGSFTKAENIGTPLNTSEHNFVCFVSKDNNRLYVANRYKKSNMTGVSVSSKDKNGLWGTPKSLSIPDMYNNNEYAHYHLNLDENILLMCVERLDGYGDLDIYVSQKYADGTWSKPKNLGNTINTVGAEASVFLAADGKTLFFSSAGHQGYGSYDMYVSKRLDNSWTNWSTPLNLGPKFNSEDMDIYYTITSNGEYAYFSSGRTYFGKNDLYRIKLPKVLQPEPIIINNPQILANSKVSKSTNSLQAAINTTQPTSNPQITTQKETPKIQQPTTNIQQPNNQTDNLQKKLDSLKNLQSNPVKPVISNQLTTKIPATAEQVTKPTTNNQQPKKDTLANKNALPQSAVMELPKQPNKYVVDSFKNIPVAQNTDPQKQVFDNLKKQPESDFTQKNTSDYTNPNTNNQYQQLPNINNNPTVNNPTLQKTTQPVYAQTQNIESNTQTLPNSNTSAPTSSTLKPKQEIQPDNFADKLAQLKQQQSDANFNQTPKKTTDYSKYTEKKDYTNPTIDYSNNIDPKKNLMEQKLYELNTPTYQESTKLSDYDIPKPYQKQELKERQENTFAKEYNETQDKIAQLKQQQQQLQTDNSKAPKISEIKVDNTNPDIKYNPPIESGISPTEIENNPQVIKYQEKLKQIQEQMNAIASNTLPKNETNPVSQNPTTSAPLKEKTETSTDAIQEKIEQLKNSQKEIAESISNPTPTSEQQDYTPVNQLNDVDYNQHLQAIEDLKKEQDQLTQQLNNTLNDLNSNKNSLEKDINDLTDERNKVSQQLDNTLNNLTQNKTHLEKDINQLAQQKESLSDEKKQLENQTEKLAQEKEKLEADKKAMDNLLAQMQEEKDRLAKEKEKMENDKLLLEKLRKQQEKEVMALSQNIDSLKKAQQKAIEANSKLQRYEIFDVPIEEGAIAIMKSIYFVADASFIQNKSYPELDKLVTFLKQNTKIQKIEIGGHTNGLCDDIFCNKLSNDRAKSVVDYLINKGISANILTYKGYGKQFLISNPGDAINQRVEVKILSVK